MSGRIQKGLVSVVIPAYNSSSFLVEAIDSALDQTYPVCEIIVVDDGSTDNTTHVLREYIQQGKIVYVHKKNGGPAAARNLGIARSKGEFIALLDADDIWLPEKLKRQMRLFQNEHIALVYSDMEFFGAATKYKSCFEAGNPFRGDVAKMLINGNFIPTSSVVIRKSVFVEVGGFNEDTHFFAVEDYHLWLRVAARYGFDFSDSILVRYRVHGAQISRNVVKTYRGLRTVYGDLLRHVLMQQWKFQLIKKYLEYTIKLIVARLLVK